MAMIDDSKKTEYFKRVFEVIDGLWFVKVEEDTDFDHALEIDRRVWEIVPKIQARKLRELLELGDDGLKSLAAALEVKAELDEAECEIELDGDRSLTVRIKKCPWLALMQKSGREHLAGRVGKVICGTEYPVWMREFGVQGSFELKQLLCDGDECCRMEFVVEDG